MLAEYTQWYGSSDAHFPACHTKALILKEWADVELANNATEWVLETL
jgi:hypothetical protein